MTYESRLVRLVLAACASSLFGAGAVLGGWFERIAASTLPPLRQHVVVYARSPWREVALTVDDQAFTRSLPGVVELHLRRSRAESVWVASPHGSQRMIAMVHSVSREWPLLAGLTAETGRMWNAGEAFVAAPVAVVTGDWPARPTVVSVGGVMHRVIGVFNTGAGISEQNPAVWLPIQPGMRAEPDGVLIQLDSAFGRDAQVAERLRRRVARDAGFAPNAQLPVSILTSTATRAELAFVRRTLLLSVVGLCTIPALFVGVSIGAITRLAIQQRVPEIGLRRAVGATRQDVLNLFVEEAFRLALGATWRAVLIGGGFVAWAAAAGISMKHSGPVVVLALLMPSLISFVFSVPAAVSAAELDPADALTRR